MESCNHVSPERLLPKDNWYLLHIDRHDSVSKYAQRDVEKEESKQGPRLDLGRDSSPADFLRASVSEKSRDCDSVEYPIVKVPESAAGLWRIAANHLQIGDIKDGMVKDADSYDDDPEGDHGAPINY
jgi:hypothetical protein